MVRYVSIVSGQPIDTSPKDKGVNVTTQLNIIEHQSRTVLKPVTIDLTDRLSVRLYKDCRPQLLGDWSSAKRTCSAA